MRNDKVETGSLGPAKLSKDSEVHGHADCEIEARDAANQEKYMKRPPEDKQVKGPEETA